jgi:predicted nucleic acid-binding protein
VSNFVLDASVSLSWFVDDPVPAAAVEIRNLLMKGQSALVPALWAFEMANGLVTAGRKGVLTPLDVSDCCDEIEILLVGSIDLVADSPQNIIRVLESSARAHSLTAYDASYLELASRRKLPLATLDRSLQISAKAAGVSLVP